MSELLSLTSQTLPWNEESYDAHTNFRENPFIIPDVIKSDK